jgi:hypothetical protein
MAMDKEQVRSPVATENTGSPFARVHATGNELGRKEEEGGNEGQFILPANERVHA